MARRAALLEEAWRSYPDDRRLLRAEEISADVSTNQVFRLHLEGGGSVVAKVSSYGSFFMFREDHDRIHRWRAKLEGTGFEGFLAEVLTVNDEVWTHYDGESWVVFYEDIAKAEMLPRILEEKHIRGLGRAMGVFHGLSNVIAQQLPWASKSLKSDILLLHELLAIGEWVERSHLEPSDARFLRGECERFLTQVDRLGYDQWARIPLLIDWNIGNFSITWEGSELRLFSRWDYDWFRADHRTLDFYFLSRVVSAVGDRTDFHYTPQTLLEPRFRLFLEAYQSVAPLSEKQILFLKEAYRFFLLNYVIKDGEHFFRPEYCSRLKQEAVREHLPSLDDFSVAPLLRGL